MQKQDNVENTSSLLQSTLFNGIQNVIGIEKSGYTSGKLK
jgi:hypothetical protein